MGMRKIVGIIIIMLLCIGASAQPMRMMIPTKSSVPAVTYATFDGSYIGSNTVLSGGNLVATMSTSQSAAMATIGGSTTGKSTGKWYWEITMTSNGGAPSVGVYSGTGANLNTYVWNNSGGYAYYYLLGGWGHATAVDYSWFDCGNFGAGDVIGVALDAGANTITFYKNGVQCTPTGNSISGGNYFPAVSSNVSTFTANFGASAFSGVPAGSGNPPPGYAAGVY